MILKKLDDKSLVKFKNSSRGINKVTDKDRVYWIRIMKKYDTSIF